MEKELSPRITRDIFNDIFARIGEEIDKYNATKIANSYMFHILSKGNYPPSKENRKMFWSEVQQTIPGAVPNDTVEFLIKDGDIADFHTMTIIRKNMKNEKQKEIFDELINTSYSIVKGYLSPEDVKLIEYSNL